MADTIYAVLHNFTELHRSTLFEGDPILVAFVQVETKRCGGMRNADTEVFEKQYLGTLHSRQMIWKTCWTLYKERTEVDEDMIFAPINARYSG